MHTVRRWKLSKKDKRRFLEEVRSVWPGVPLSDDVEVELVSDKKAGIQELYVIDGRPAFIRVEGRLVPLINYLLEVGVGWLPRVVVDEGAVRPITRGANLLRPGITRVEGSFEKGDLIVILEPLRGIPIAVHEALVSSAELEGMERGVVSKRLHYMGDRYWKYARSV